MLIRSALHSCITFFFVKSYGRIISVVRRIITGFFHESETVQQSRKLLAGFNSFLTHSFSLCVCVGVEGVGLHNGVNTC